MVEVVSIANATGNPNPRKSRKTMMKPMMSIVRLPLFLVLDQRLDENRPFRFDPWVLGAVAGDDDGDFDNDVDQGKHRHRHRAERTSAEYAQVIEIPSPADVMKWAPMAKLKP